MQHKSGAELARAAGEAARKNVAEGEAAVERARVDLATRPKPKSLAVRKPACEDRGPSLLAMVEHILAAERAGRSVVAAVGLAHLRTTYEALDASTGADWDAFARQHLEPALGLDRISTLIGRMVHRGSLLHCTGCSAETKSACSCGVPYIGERWVTIQPEPPKEMTALERAATAIAAHPEMSDRAIAEQIGVGRQTVGRARQQMKSVAADGTVDGTVGARVGRDGRRRRVADGQI